MSETASTSSGSGRYQRQMLLAGIGPEGQRKLGESRVLLIGCGALGSVMAEQLVRSGVGYLRIVDRDVVEWSNLQRQVLFEEADAKAGVPKAVAAAKRLAAINSSVRVEARVEDVHGGNIEELIEVGNVEQSTVNVQRRREDQDPHSYPLPEYRAREKGVDLILDGTDNVETRYLVNDVSVKHGIPWVYGACVGTEGRVMAVKVGGACLRCVFPKPPAAGELATCDTAGVLGAAAGVVASLQVAAAIKMLTGNAVNEEIIGIDVWNNKFRAMSLAGARREDCVCCGQRVFEMLNSAGPATVALCGRNAVQVRAAKGTVVNLAAMAKKLAGAGTVEETAYLVRCRLREPEGVGLTVFGDGRVLVQGTDDLGRARSIAARFVGA